jgi:hypothetical protein
VPEDVSAEQLQVGARLAGHANLVDVRTFKLEAGCEVVPPHGKQLGFDFSFDVLDSELDDATLTSACGCEVELFIVDDGREDSTSRVEVGRLAVVVGALFSVRPPESEAFTQAEIDAFCETTVRLTLYPYVRAAVSDLTGRLGLPHLSLPTYKIALPTPS